MRKAKPKPTLRHSLPEDLETLLQCRLFLEFPDEYNADNFAKQLAEWIVRNVRPRRLTGPEMAAMVDNLARFRPSISAAITQVADILGPTYSVAAIRRAHDDYGDRAAIFKKLRADDKEWEDRHTAAMREEDRLSLEALSRTMSAAFRPHRDRLARFRNRRNHIIKQSVVEDD